MSTKDELLPSSQHDVKLPVSGMCFFRWTTKKPKFDSECMVICANKWKDQGWEYSLYQIKKVEFEDRWYWGWLSDGGEECGDLADMESQLYYVMPLLDAKRSKKTFPLTSSQHDAELLIDNSAYYCVTPYLRYAKKLIVTDEQTTKYELRLQQMWQSSDGSQKWEWIEELVE